MTVADVIDTACESETFRDGKAGSDLRASPRAGSRGAPQIVFVASDILAMAAALAAAAALVGTASGVSAAARLAVAFGYAESLGTGWHGWGLLLVLVVALTQFNGLGHYSRHVRPAAALRETMGVGLLALFCDYLVSAKIGGVAFGVEQTLRWPLFVVLVLAFRTMAAWLLARADGRPAAEAPPGAAGSVGQFAKRALDLAAASALLALLSPLMLAIALLIRARGGPALYSHMRVGAAGRAFGCLKFRSMDVDADRKLAELLARDPASAEEWARARKLRHDPRITPVGRFIRKTSLDELPQLINVLRGEMSLVGPRPIVQSELTFYGDRARYYLQARPGLTGLWQISGRSDASYERRVRLDAFYVRNWSLGHDVAILMKTVPVVLLRRGAV